MILEHEARNYLLGVQNILEIFKLKAWGLSTKIPQGYPLL
jgi:hypothetical protein